MSNAFSVASEMGGRNNRELYIISRVMQVVEVITNEMSQTEEALSLFTHRNRTLHPLWVITFGQERGVSDSIAFECIPRFWLEKFVLIDDAAEGKRQLKDFLHHGSVHVFKDIGFVQPHFFQTKQLRPISQCATTLVGQDIVCEAQ